MPCLLASVHIRVDYNSLESYQPLKRILAFSAIMFATVLAIISRNANIGALSTCSFALDKACSCVLD